jgi:phenylpropionate dioxygenase-like ring-hydroxylating dioxygenase large terminal subunit
MGSAEPERDELVRGGAGLVAWRVFVDEALSALALERAFNRCWPLPGHASKTPDVADYVTRRVSAGQVIVMRGP